MTSVVWPDVYHQNISALPIVFSRQSFFCCREKLEHCGRQTPSPAFQQLQTSTSGLILGFVSELHASAQTPSPCQLLPPLFTHSAPATCSHPSLLQQACRHERSAAGISSTFARCCVTLPGPFLRPREPPSHPFLGVISSAVSFLSAIGRRRN